MTERTYSVATCDGVNHLITADYAFENTCSDGVALVFRQGEKGHTNVVASFAPRAWNYYMVVPTPTDPIPDNEAEHSIDVEDPRFDLGLD